MQTFLGDFLTIIYYGLWTFLGIFQMIDIEISLTFPYNIFFIFCSCDMHKKLTKHVLLPTCLQSFNFLKQLCHNADIFVYIFLNTLTELRVDP